MAEEPQNPAARVRNQAGDWLRPTRAVAISFDVRKVALAAVGLLMLQAGWLRLGWYMFGPEYPVGPSPYEHRGFAVTPYIGNAVFITISGAPGEILNAAARRVAEPAFVLIAPLRRVFAGDGPNTTQRGFLMATWVVIVFGIIGGAIARSAVMEAGRGERLGLFESLRFSLKRAGPLIGATLLPFLAALFCLLIAAVFGPLHRLPGGFGAVAGGAGFVVSLALGLVAALLLVDLAVSWPLTHAAAAVEGEDAIETMTRAFGCVNRRPVRFVALVGLVWLVGTVGLIVVEFLAITGLNLAIWATAFTVPDPHGLASSWLPTVGLLVQSWIYAYFWSAAALIYLTLRRDIDGAPWSEIAPGP